MRRPDAKKAKKISKKTLNKLFELTGLSKSEVADRLGISVRQIDNILSSGEYRYWFVYMLEDLANCYPVTLGTDIS
jgi:hypothetical protein